MSALAEHVHNYLQLRRALGFKLRGEETLLREFVAFADAAGQDTVSTQFALQWARRPASASANYLSRRLRAVRGFARYLHALDPACEIPPLELLPASKYRPAPYLYRDQEILELMAAARRLRPQLRAATFETLIGLLACTGLRIPQIRCFPPAAAERSAATQSRSWSPNTPTPPVTAARRYTTRASHRTPSGTPRR